MILADLGPYLYYVIMNRGLPPPVALLPISSVQTLDESNPTVFEFDVFKSVRIEWA